MENLNIMVSIPKSKDEYEFEIELPSGMKASEIIDYIVNETGLPSEAFPASQQNLDLELHERSLGNLTLKEAGIKDGTLLQLVERKYFSNSDNLQKTQSFYEVTNIETQEVEQKSDLGETSSIDTNTGKETKDEVTSNVGKNTKNQKEGKPFQGTRKKKSKTLLIVLVIFALVSVTMAIFILIRVKEATINLLQKDFEGSFMGTIKSNNKQIPIQITFKKPKKESDKIVFEYETDFFYGKKLLQGKATIILDKAMISFSDKYLGKGKIQKKTAGSTNEIIIISNKKDFWTLNK